MCTIETIQYTVHTVMKTHYKPSITAKILHFEYFIMTVMVSHFDSASRNIFENKIANKCCVFAIIKRIMMTGFLFVSGCQRSQDMYQKRTEMQFMDLIMDSHHPLSLPVYEISYMHNTAK